MPGLFGFIRAHPAAQAEMERDLRVMQQSMSHLPTYMAHTHVEIRAAFGRIGPSFLNPEKQPVFSEHGKRLVVFEGELYEPEPARQRLEKTGHVFRNGCDAEVALHAFEEGGTRSIAELAGAYVGCFYDATTGACHLFTDRLGLRGCYYSVIGDGTFVFASEAKAIAALAGFAGHVDTQAVAEFLACNSPLFDRTFFKEVKVVPYGSVVSWTGGGVSTERYWDFPPAKSPSDWRFEDAVAEGAEHLVTAVRRQLRRDGPVGVLMSGGLDSRAIVAGATHCGRPVLAFTFGGSGCLEAKLAARVCDRLGVEHRVFDVRPDFLVDRAGSGAWYTDGMLLPTHFVWLQYLQEIAASCRTLLTGYSDIFLGAYDLAPVHLGHPSVDEQRQWLADKVSRPWPAIVETALRPEVGKAFKAAHGESRREIMEDVGERGFTAETLRAVYAHRERRCLNLAFGGLLGIFADVKYPLADYDLMNFCSRLPTEWVYHSRLYKALHCKAFRELVDIPCISAKTKFVPCTLNADPRPLQIRWRALGEKMRFWLGVASNGRLSLRDRRTYLHYDHWYRTTPRLREWLSSILLSERTLGRGYFDRQGIERLLRLEMKRGYLFATLARLVAFEYWNRFFVDRQPPPVQATANVSVV